VASPVILATGEEENQRITAPCQSRQKVLEPPSQPTAGCGAAHLLSQLAESTNRRIKVIKGNSIPKATNIKRALGVAQVVEHQCRKHEVLSSSLPYRGGGSTKRKWKKWNYNKKKQRKVSAPMMYITTWEASLRQNTNAICYSFCLRHAPSTFSLKTGSRVFAWGILDSDPICAFCVAGIIGMNYHMELLCWDGVLLTFCQVGSTPSQSSSPK
jgi:hypothetical protein